MNVCSERNKYYREIKCKFCVNFAIYVPTYMFFPNINIVIFFFKLN